MHFMSIFQSKNPVIISEIKFASPSRGQIYSGQMDHVEIAQQYLNQGAAAISVLTEPYGFKGDVHYIQDIRKLYPKSCLLMKDFIREEQQILVGKEMGANAVLLIAADLSPPLLKDLYETALALSLTPLIEIHHISELEPVLKLSPSVVGVNNRSLKTGVINLDISRKLIKYIPSEIKVICESGISRAEQIREMESLGFNGFLIGGAFMDHPNPGSALQKIISEYYHES